MYNIDYKLEVIMSEKDKFKVRMRARILRVSADNIEKLKKIDDSIYEELAAIKDNRIFLGYIKVATAGYKNNTEIKAAIHIFHACSSVNSSNIGVINILTDEDFINSHVAWIIAEDIDCYSNYRMLILSDIYDFIKNSKQSSLEYKEKCVGLILKAISKYGYKEAQGIIEILSNSRLTEENLALPSAELMVKNSVISHYVKHLIKSDIAIKSGTAKEGLKILAQVNNTQSASSICNVLTDEDTIKAGVAVDGAKIITTCTSNINTHYTELVLTNAEALASGKAKEGASVVSMASAEYNARNMYQVLTNPKIIKYGLSLEGAKIINKAVNPYSSDLAEELLSEVNDQNLPYLLEAVEIVSNTIEYEKVEAMCDIFLSPVALKAGTVIEGIRLVLSANEYKANLISLALKDQTLDELKLSMDVAKVVAGKFTKENLDKVKKALEDEKVKSSINPELIKEIEIIILKDKINKLLTLFGYTIEGAIAVQQVYGVLSALLGASAIDELVKLAESEEETIKRATITIHINKLNKANPKHLVKQIIEGKLD